MKTFAVVALLAWAAWAQAPSIAPLPPTYPIAIEQKAKLRDIQIQMLSLDIENFKLQLQIEQNKAKRTALVNDLQATAFDYAQQNHIDLSAYELDIGPMQFAKKKAAK